MILNPVIYIKNTLFANLEQKVAVVSDGDITVNEHISFFKLENPEEAVGKVVALAEEFEKVFVILDTWNWDSIYRVFKTAKDNVCVLNLNAGLTGLGHKISLLDLDDIDAHNTDIVEPMDVANIDFYVDKFMKNPGKLFIRIPNKDVEQKIGAEEVDMDYGKIVSLAEFGIQGFSGTMLVYGSMFQEALQAANMLQEEALGVDMFWIGDYGQKFSPDVIKSVLGQERLFVVGDFDAERFEKNINSKLYNIGAEKMDIHFITPENLNSVEDESQMSFCGMDGLAIYSRVKVILSN